jgi:hypothetical protein
MINVLINPQTTCKLPANVNSGLPNAVINAIDLSHGALPHARRLSTVAFPARCYLVKMGMQPQELPAGLQRANGSSKRVLRIGRNCKLQMQRRFCQSIVN